MLLLNENKLDEMSEILAEYMKRVPTLPAVGHHVLPNKSVVEFDDTRFHSVLLVVIS